MTILTARRKRLRPLWSVPLTVVLCLLAFRGCGVLTRNHDPIVPRQMLPPRLARGLVVTDARLPAKAAGGTALIDLATGEVRLWLPSTYHAIFARDGRWVWAAFPGPERRTLITERGIRRMKPVETISLSAGQATLSPDGCLAAIVPRRQLTSTTRLDTWRSGEPHVLVLFDPLTGQLHTEAATGPAGMRWCFSNRPGEIITECRLREEWETVRGRQARREVEGLYRQDLATGKRSFIVEGSHPCLSRGGRLAYLEADGRTIAIREPSGKTTRSPAVRRWVELYAWTADERFVLWGYNNWRASILDHWLKVRYKGGQDVVIGATDVRTGASYRILPNKRLGYGSRPWNVQCVDRLSPRLVQTLYNEGMLPTVGVP